MVLLAAVGLLTEQVVERGLVQRLASSVTSAAPSTAERSRGPGVTSPSVPGKSVGPSIPEEQVAQVLARRAQAVLRRDRAAFLATVDNRRPAFYRSQSALFGRMATVPFSEFRYALPSPLRNLATDRVRRRYGPSGVFVFPVEASYRFRGQDTSPVLARYYYTFAFTPAGWQIAGTDDLKPKLRDDVQIWDAGPVQTVATKRTLVVFHPGDATLARRLLNGAERGYTQVDATWSSSWDHKVVILVPRDQSEAQRLVRTRDLSDVAAVTSSVIEAGPAHRVLGNRIITNTTIVEPYSTINLQILLTHEMTHVATRRVGVGVPLYLVEGFADYTALRPLDLPLQVTRPSLAAAVEGGRFDGRLPSRSQLVGADAAVAYDEGSSFCLWVARTFGEAKVQALYRSFGDLDGDPTRRDEDVRLRRVLGVSRATAEARWAAFVRGSL
jgi:hypothetical protein